MPLEPRCLSYEVQARQLHREIRNPQHIRNMSIGQRRDLMFEDQGLVLCPQHRGPTTGHGFLAKRGHLAAPPFITTLKGWWEIASLPFYGS